MEKKITKWLNDGLIDEKTATVMLCEIKDDKAKSFKTKINITIYTIAVILSGIGAITFISANDWILMLFDEIYHLKIILMLICTFGTLLFGYYFGYEKKNFPKLGNALIFLSSLLIGGTYALIGQIYNINANSSVIIFLWLLCVLPLAYFFKNRAINILSIILTIFFIMFFYLELSLDTKLVWTIFIPVIIGLTLYSAGNIPFVLNKFNDFSLTYKIVGVLPIFITLLVLTCSVENSYHITAGYYIIPIVFLILFNMINYVCQKESNILLKIETISIVMTASMLLLLLVLPSVNSRFVIILANAFIILMITLGYNYGYKFEKGNLIGITNLMLTIFLIVNYCRWGWSYMDKSLFFIVGGSVLFSLGLFLERNRRGVIKKWEQK